VNQFFLYHQGDEIVKNIKLNKISNKIFYLFLTSRLKPPPVINGPTFPWWEKRVSSQAKRHLLSVPKLSVQMKKRQYIMFNSKQRDNRFLATYIMGSQMHNK